MATEIKHIESPRVWEASDDWDSHRPMLYLALSNVKDLPITEFGCGYGSTVLLYNQCKSEKRLFFSYETNRDWGKKFDLVTIMQDYDQVHLSDGDKKQGILFIDSAPGEQRRELIAKHANNALVIIVHDTEPGANYVYGMAEVLNTFKYRLDYQPEGKPHTTAVSNFINVEEWKSM